MLCRNVHLQHKSYGNNAIRWLKNMEYETDWSFVSLIKEAYYDKVKVYGKHKIGTLLFGVGVISTTVVISLITTTTTQVVKYEKEADSLCAASCRTVHDLSEIPFVFIDYVLFGEYVP